jgi:chaperone required for assembly of F1-ATPase
LIAALNMAEPIRRFYERAAVDGDGVMLDQRRLRTPRGAAFAAPTAPLAAAIAEEWNAQGEHIIPSSMPLTQLAFAAIDHTPGRREALADYVAKFGETDLVCHRAAAPAALVARQAKLWDPLVAWSARDLGVMLSVVTGVSPAAPHPEGLETLRAHAAACDDFQLTALAQAAGAAGSAVVGLALLHGRLNAESAFAAAALEDIWSMENWGEDAEARARLDAQRRELENVQRFLALLSAP